MTDGDCRHLKKAYLDIIRRTKTDILIGKKLPEAEENIRFQAGYSIMPWEEVKREIEEELGRRSGTGPVRDVAGLIWELRDTQ